MRSNLLTYGLIAGGVALIFKDQLKALLPKFEGTSQEEQVQPTAPPPGVKTTFPTPAPPELTPATPSKPAPPPTTAAPAAPPPGAAVYPPYVTAMIQAAAPARSLNWDQWNYYYEQVTGQPGPAPESVGLARTDPMPLITPETWYNQAHGAGVLAGIVMRYQL